MLDLAIAYRIYPGVSKTPAVFADNKYKLSAFCLQSFKRALGSLRVKIWVLLDNCPPEYESLFRSCFDEEVLQIVPLQGAGNHATFSMQIDILTRQTDAALVYLAEDDYFYFPDAIVKMVDFARSNPNIDFVTPYDHSDLYTRSTSREKHLIRAFGDRHWRTVSSTCLTFLAKREALVQAQRGFRTYSQGNHDCSTWLALTGKTSLLNLRVHWHDVESLKIWVRLFRWGLGQILFGRRYSLWSPIPTLGTHMESSCLAPVVDWNSEFMCAENEAKPTSPDNLNNSGPR